eukprot:scaffold441657_cov22-Prasinocladus_malaysianus.AAC.1
MDDLAAQMQLAASQIPYLNLALQSNGEGPVKLSITPAAPAPFSVTLESDEVAGDVKLSLLRKNDL